MAVTRAQRAVLADRRAKLVQYRIEGRRYIDVYEELGYSSPNDASRDFNRILETNIAEQRTSLEVYREIEVLRLDGELERLNTLYAKVEAILEREHVTVSVGRVVELNGEPIPDEGPFLQAVDRLLRIDDARRKNAERRSKLLGLDSAQRVEVLTIDAIDQQLGFLVDELAALDGQAGEAAAAEGPAS